MSDNLLDLAVRLEIVQRFPCKRTVNLQTIDEGGNGDEAVRLDILLELVVDLLVEDHGVVGLVLDYASVSGGSCSRDFESARRGAQAVELVGWVFERAADGFGGCRGAECVRCGAYHVPLPLDHFFFCFLPPVAAGA